ncbi:MAG: hypothetical protein IT536_03085 [Hyphomicrobiales bacterium]|nr:hypothetical protein [Hyphomicrobiales bacterium]
MIPDLRFVIGAVTATVLLGVTVFGLLVAVHISHQSKVGPLEASRLLAYTADSARHARQPPAGAADHPFAGFPTDAAPPLARSTESAEVRPPIEATETAAAPAAAKPPDEADTVDERAVVDPPLPVDDSAPASTADAPAPVADGAPSNAAPSDAVSVPATVPAAEESPPSGPALASPVDAASAASNPVTEETAPSPAAPAAEPAARITGAAADLATPAPSADETTVGSIPNAAAERVDNAPPAVEAGDALPKKARPARKAVAKAKAARRAATIAPTASTGYPVGFSGTTAPASARPAIGFWGD